MHSLTLSRTRTQWSKVISEAISEETGATLGLATALGNLGVCHHELGNMQMLTFFVNAR